MSVAPVIPVIPEGLDGSGNQKADSSLGQPIYSKDYETSRDYEDGYNPSKASFAKFLVRAKVLKDLEKVPAGQLPKDIVGDPRPGDLIPPRSTASRNNELPKDFKVGIIGAGIAGIYTGLLLQSIGIDYEILEANPHRIGGRLYTHYFTVDKEKNENLKHQYYDIGAMRFPRSPIMWRTFDLFWRTRTQLGEYLMKDKDNKQPMRYNDITSLNTKEFDPFRVSTKYGGNVPCDTVRNPDEILHDAYFPFRRKIKRALEAFLAHEKQKKNVPKGNADKLKEWSDTETKLLGDLERAWNYLIQHDKFSLRDYLGFVEGLDDESIHWLETINSGTGWFDQAFSESVMESLAFDYSHKGDDSDSKADSGDAAQGTTPTTGNDIPWKFVENGTKTLTENAVKLLKNKPQLGKTVTAMTLEYDAAKTPKVTGIKVTVAGEDKPRKYQTVFNTTTFAALQKMDTTGLKLPYALKTAIRSLRYDASTKVAIRFKVPWWIQHPKADKPNDCLDGILGGLGLTDLPLRTCVYPSYNINDDKNKPAVLLCSYSWGQDSERIGSMIHPVDTSSSHTPGLSEDHYPKVSESQELNSQKLDDKKLDDQKLPDLRKPEDWKLLKETMIDNLARLHSTSESGYQTMKEVINDNFMEQHAYDWSKDPYTCGGAFALFSSSQFRSLYPNAVLPAADSRFHIIGEAASANHAWIVGALDSSLRGTRLMLERFKQDELVKKLRKIWGVAGEVDENTAHLQVALGMLDPTKLPTESVTAQVGATEI